MTCRAGEAPTAQAAWLSQIPQLGIPFSFGVPHRPHCLPRPAIPRTSFSAPETRPCWAGGTAAPQLPGPAGWALSITTEALEIKVGELGNDLVWCSAEAQGKAGLQNDLCGSAAPASAFVCTFPSGRRRSVGPRPAGWLETCTQGHGSPLRLPEPRGSGKGS